MGYRTISESIEISFIEKKSEFIAKLTPVSTNDEAIACIDNVRREHRKARHVVYAYILRDNNITRYSDDGEPQGTAGMPVLDVLQKNNLTDICCTVTRYFGGILLGGGGLVRAYSHSTALAVNSAHIMQMEYCRPVTLNMDYSMYGKIQYHLPNYSILQTGTDFGDSVILSLLIQQEQIEKFKKDIIELSNGKIKMQTGNLQYADFSEKL